MTGTSRFDVHSDAVLAAVVEVVLWVVIALRILPTIEAWGLPIILAAVIVVQVATSVALNERSPSIRKTGAFAAAALAAAGLLITLTFAASLLLIVAAFVIDSAAGHPPADLDQILVELHLAQYLSAGGLAMAVPIVGLPSLLNARAALAAFSHLQEGRTS